MENKGLGILALALAAWLSSASQLAFAAPNPEIAPETEETAEETTEKTGLSTPDLEDNVAGSYLSGRFARAHGDIDEAARYLRRVLDRQPDNMGIAAQLQGMLLLQGKIDEASIIARQIRDNDARDPLADLLLAVHALRAHKLDEASAVLAQAGANGNLQLWVPLLQGWVDIERGTFQKPLTQQAFEIDIGRALPLVNYHLALVNARAGFTEAATTNFRDALQNPQEVAPRMMMRAIDFYRRNQQPAAALEPVIKQFEDSAAQYADEGDLPQLSTAADGVAEVLYSMGSIMFAAGVVNDAAIYLQLAAYIKPDMAEAHLALGDAFGQLGQFKRSNIAYENVTPGDELHARAQLHIAVNYDRMSRTPEALALLDKIAAKNKENADALITKGDLYRIHGEYEKAVKTYNQAISRMGELEAADWPVLFARGSCHERLGNWPSARKDLQAALTLKPDQPEVLNYLGYAQLERGENVEEAQAMIARAVEARPNDAQIVDSMGWMLFLKGDYEASLGYMEKAAELLPTDATVNDHLGDVYWRLDRKTEARFQWERALNCKPDAKLAATLQKKLKDGLPDSATVASSVSASAAP